MGCKHYRRRINLCHKLILAAFTEYGRPDFRCQRGFRGYFGRRGLFCIKQGKAPQFGICVSKQGYKSGELVGAISAASALDGLSSFVAVFKVNTGWWYICVRNDIILSDGDMVFVNEEDAKTQFMSMLAVPDWEKKIAPAEWNIDGTEDIDLTELMKKGAAANCKR